MVNESELREYAQNIYDGVEGYTFDKVRELFPLYYYPIRGYYLMIFMEEQAEKNKEIYNKTLQYLLVLKISLFSIMKDANKHLKKYKDRKLTVEEFNKAVRLRFSYLNKISDLWISDIHSWLVSHGRLSESVQLFEEYRDRIWQPSVKDVIRRRKNGKQL